MWGVDVWQGEEGEVGEGEEEETGHHPNQGCGQPNQGYAGKGAEEDSDQDPGPEPGPELTSPFRVPRSSAVGTEGTMF